jgi:excisionase family DNA binding protein
MESAGLLLDRSDCCPVRVTVAETEHPPQASGPDVREFLTIAEVADLLRCSAPTVRRWVRSGTLNAYRLANSGPWLFRRDDILRHLTPVPIASASSFTGSGTCPQSASVDWVAGLTGATTSKAHHHGA